MDLKYKIMVDFYCCCYKTYYIQSQERMPWTRLKGIRIAQSRRAQKRKLTFKAIKAPHRVQLSAVSHLQNGWQKEKYEHFLTRYCCHCLVVLTCAEDFRTQIRSLSLLPTSSLPCLRLIFRYGPSFLFFSTLTTIAPVFVVALDDPSLWS